MQDDNCSCCPGKLRREFLANVLSAGVHLMLPIAMCYECLLIPRHTVGGRNIVQSYLCAHSSSGGNECLRAAAEARLFSSIRL